MIKVHKARSCCGREAWIFETENPVITRHLEAFKKAGYAAPSHMFKAGMFFVEKAGMIASCPLGSNKVQVKCTLRDCSKINEEFKNLLDELTKKNDNK